MTNGLDYGTWYLDSNPFSPVVGPDGAIMDPRLFSTHLDPRKEERTLHYYFDHYEWERSDTLGPIGADGRLMKFPSEPGVTPHVILISGDSDTGRRSLANLTLYEAHQCWGVAETPIVINVDLRSNKRNDAMVAVANRLPFVLARHIDEIPRSDIQQMVREYLDSPNQDFNSLFDNIAEWVSECTDAAIILNLEGGNHADTWRMIHDAAKQLCQLIVITSPDVVQTGKCATKMSDDRLSVSLVRAQLLGVRQARSFLERRLALHRARTAPSDLDSLIPFAPGAIEALFELIDGTDTPAYRTIRWLGDTFKTVLDDFVEREGAAEARIDRDRVLSIRSNMNLGAV